ncbi:unnamed protein product [Orchesella dallaii]|uniref:Uncharacterized protein n=1 Tax=Orchesella dallaii TaxID=48710 RepID=A0ABP1RSJ1_9HEXA
MITLSKVETETNSAVQTYLNAFSKPERSPNSLKGSLLFEAFASTSVFVLLIFIPYVYVVLQFNDFVYSLDDNFGPAGIGGVNRISRFLSTSLSLYKRQPFRDIHEDPNPTCFIKNPFFETNSPPCHLCKGVHTVLDLSEVSTFSENFHSQKIPFMVKNSFKTPIKLDTMEKVLGKNFGFEKFPQANSHMKLEMGGYKLTHLLRGILPTPTKRIPRINLIDIHHRLLIDGPSSPSYWLPPPELEIAYVIQLHGRRMIKLRPTWSCIATCTTMSVILEPGDVLHYNIFLWNAISEPVVNKGTTADLSIIRMGSLEA